MAQPIFAYIVHKDGIADDTAAELAVAAKKIDENADPVALVLGAGSALDAVCKDAAEFYKEVWKINHDSLTQPNAEIIRGMLVNLLPQDAIVLVPHDTFGLDLSPGLSIKLDSAFISDTVDIEGGENGKLKVVRQEFTGLVSTHVQADISGGAVINIRPGVFQPKEGAAAGGNIVDKSADAPADIKRKFLEIVEAEVGDVDITKEEVLVSVGRGIEEEENLSMVNDLAEAMGAVVSCSRPIVDAKWLEKSRQVGTSGQTVKPKVYLALGISGSFQHMGGVKGNPFIIAVNKNPKAPIFQVADVGVEADILEFVPELAERIQEMK
jgi:electron transfer flavoprotein alpha subunit